MGIFDRTKKLIGTQKLSKLNNTHVTVVGIGGVGGYACEMLARAGIGNFTLIDFDKIDETNINRQIIALSSTVGKNKVDVMKERILDINPNAKVEAILGEISSETLDVYILSTDYIVDAIDSVTHKVNLIAYAKAKEIPIISAMGAGNRWIEPNFVTTDIFKTYNDGLAKIVRKKLKELGITSHKVVFCDSNLNVENNDLSDTIEAASTKKVNGSISYFPAIAGIKLAYEVIFDLLKEEKNNG